VNVWAIGGLSALCALSAAVSCWVAALLSSKLLALAEFKARLTAIEANQDKVLAMQKRLAQRQNLGEYRESLADNQTPRRSDKSPDWQKDPAGFIAFHERKQRGR